MIQPGLQVTAQEQTAHARCAYDMYTRPTKMFRTVRRKRNRQENDRRRAEIPIPLGIQDSCI
jgi:hypothetical protein